MILITVDPLTPVKTIQSALNLILDETKEAVTIYIKKGIYKEKLKLIHPNLTLVGEDKDETIITFDDYSLKKHKDGRNYDGFRSYTVMVLAPNITFHNLTIINSSGYGDDIGQAIALHINADMFSAFNCNFYSREGTVFNGPLPDDLVQKYDGFLLDEERTSGVYRQYFEHCHIKGDINYIFGCGTVIFDNCLITSLHRDNNNIGSICAPAQNINVKYGHIFISCEFNHESCSSNSVYLARPWKDYGMAAFINCLYNSHIKKDGFDTGNNKKARFFEYEAINDDLVHRVEWVKKLSNVDLIDYKSENIFNDWNPLTHRNEVFETFKSSQI